MPRIDVILATDAAPLNAGLAQSAAKVNAFAATVDKASTTSVASTGKVGKAFVGVGEGAAAGSAVAKKEVGALESVTASAGRTISTMGNNLGQWGIPFTGALSKVGAQLSSTGEQSVGTFQKMSAAGGLMTTAIVVGAVAIGVEAVHMTDTLDQSTARMDTSFKNSGISVKGAQSEVSTFEAKMRLLGVTDAKTEDSLSRIVLSTHNVSTAIKDTAVAQDLAAARGIDLTKATDMVVKAQNGQYTSLRRLGLVTAEQVKGFRDGGAAVDLDRKSVV